MTKVSYILDTYWTKMKPSCHKLLNCQHYNGAMEIQQ